ncbi:DNA polymerase III subunit beta [Martelella endophytica]|uniref:DNA polymerase III subunit beta n=1 Tax=Martelella endophytica TaxID=1486262 RepID=UPI000698DB4C|nr:DNA polymerase III subunit beta [Martelella endophytica]
MFKAEKSALLSALETARGAVERRNTIPILANVLFEEGGEKGHLRVRATDLDIEITVKFAAEIDKGFMAFTVPAQLMTSIVKNMGGSEISVTAEPDKSGGLHEVVVRSGRSRFRVPVLPATDFPSLPEIREKPFELDAAAFRQGLIDTAFAIAPANDSREMLKGVFIDRREHDIALVATHGHYMARRIIDAGESPSDLPAAIIPDKTVSILTKALPEAGTLQVAIDDSRISIGMGSKSISSKLIDATYHDYNRMILPGMDLEATADRKALAEAVKRVGLVASEMSRAAVLQFGKGTLSVEMASPDAGDATDELEIECGFEERVGINQSYLAATLDHIPGSRVTMRRTKGGDRVEITSPDGHDDDIVIVMMMRV